MNSNWYMILHDPYLVLSSISTNPSKKQGMCHSKDSVMTRSFTLIALHEDSISFEQKSKDRSFSCIKPIRFSFLRWGYLINHYPTRLDGWRMKSSLGRIYTSERRQNFVFVWGEGETSFLASKLHIVNIRLINETASTLQYDLSCPLSNFPERLVLVAYLYYSTCFL